MLSATAIMSRRSAPSTNHHHMNVNISPLQKIRRFSSYQFDPPKPSSSKLNNVFFFGAGILVGAFCIHVNSVSEDTPGYSTVAIRFGQPFSYPVIKDGDYVRQNAQEVKEKLLVEFLDSGVHLAIAAMNNNAPDIAVERYLLRAANFYNLRCLRDEIDPPRYLDKLEVLEDDILPQFKRMVMVKYDDEKTFGAYQLMDYDGMDNYIVRGPLFDINKEDRNKLILTNNSYDDSNIITVKKDDVYLAKGLPVECHGLEGDGSILNGAIGSVEHIDEEDHDAIMVSFEDPSLSPPMWINRKNLRVVINLPLKSEGPIPLKMCLYAPVICHGLKFDNEKHLNGKVGTVMGISEEEDTAYVRFEDPDIPDMVVSTKNLFLSCNLPKRVD